MIGLIMNCRGVGKKVFLFVFVISFMNTNLILLGFKKQ
jgi:hypothetical protein